MAVLTWGMSRAWGLPEDMALVLCAAAWMLVWWIVEAVPLGVTSLLPLVLFPTLGLTGVAEAAAPYGSKYVFLFMGGFLIAIALERWHLHKRFALNVLVAAGESPAAVGRFHGRHSCAEHVDFQHGDHVDDVAHRDFCVVQP